MALPIFLSALFSNQVDSKVFLQVHLTIILQTLLCICIIMILKFSINLIFKNAWTNLKPEVKSCSISQQITIFGNKLFKLLTVELDSNFEIKLWLLMIFSRPVSIECLIMVLVLICSAKKEVTALHD